MQRTIFFEEFKEESDVVKAVQFCGSFGSCVWHRAIETQNVEER
jgi:hypothetical protein